MVRRSKLSLTWEQRCLALKLTGAGRNVMNTFRKVYLLPLGTRALSFSSKSAVGKRYYLLSTPRTSYNGKAADDFSV